METNSALLEHVNELAQGLKEVGWDVLSDFQDDAGITLDNLKPVAERLRDMAATNPLLKRGAQLRHGYVFGRGMNWSDHARSKKFMETSYNKSALFSTGAWEQLNLAKYTDGNVFVLRNLRTNLITRVPLSQITACVTDPDSAERIWFIKRQWSANEKTFERWYRLNTYTGAQKTLTEAGKKFVIDTEHVMYHEAANRQVGWTWGIPDSMAAMVWAIAYSEYIKNNAALVRAYANFAYKVQSQTGKGQQNVAAQVAGPSRVAGTAITGPGTDLVPLPAMGSTVDFSKGTAIASLVAASLGVSVIALLTDPSSAAGSYGSAQTLDAPTIQGMRAIQETWTEFFQTVVRDMGARNAEVSFPSIETDAPHRRSQILTAGLESGALHRAEVRAKYIELADIENPLKSLPEPDVFSEKIKNPGQGESGTPGMVTGTKTRDEE